MSRCFPYPPPGYCRNGAPYEALIESIKLQKETDKAKSERRKEKREKKEKKEKKKNEKEKRKNDEKAISQNNQSLDSHKLHKLDGFTEARIKGTKVNTELLEKSDLTEENGQPIQPSYSSDSTQNSNKRRRDNDGLLPDDSTGHGKPFKIRFLKKHKGSDSINSDEDARLKTVSLVQPSNSDRTLLVSSNRNNAVPATSGRENNAPRGIPLTHKGSVSSNSVEDASLKTVPFVQPSNLDRTLLVSRYRNNGVPATSRRENNVPRGIPLTHKGSDYSNSGEDARLKTVPVQPSNLDRTPFVSSHRINGVPATSGRENNAPEGIPLTQTKSHTSFDKTKTSSPNGSFAKPVLPSGTRKIDAEVLKSSRQQIESFVRPVVPRSRSELEFPSSSVSRNIGVEGLNAGRQQKGPSTLKPVIHDPVLSKPSPSVTGKRPLDEITVPGNSGPNKLEKKTEGSQKSGHTRSEKKILKKQAKYEKLLGSWAPPVFQALLPDVYDDEDWLCRSTKTAKSSLSRDEAETCRESAETSLWQPHARFLAEADIYALPYTVPF